MEAHQVVARHARHRRFRARARQRVTVRVIGPVEQLREDAQRHLHRLHFLPLDARQALALLAVEVGLRERRIEDHVGEDIERRVEVFLERRQLHAGDVELRARTEVRAQLRQRVADLQRGAPRRPFVQHVERETRRAWRRELIRRVTGIHEQRQVHLRNRVTLGEHDLESVRQGRARDRREARVGRRSGLGQLGAVRAARGCLERGIRMHFERPVAVGEPARRGRLEVGGGRRGDALPRHLVMVGAAGVPEPALQTRLRKIDISEPLVNGVVRLTHTHRFGGTIASLADAVRTVTGTALRPAYEFRELELPAAPSEDEWIDRFKTAFDAEEISTEEPGS